MWQLPPEGVNSRGHADAATGETEGVGQLVNNDRHPDAREEAGDERKGEEVGNPAQLGDANNDERNPRDYRRRGDQREVLRRLRQGQSAEGHGEERSDRGVRPHRQNRVRSHEGVDQRGDHKGQERAEGWHPSQISGGELFRDGNC